MLTAGSLCAGIGGIDLGLAPWARTVFVSEIDAHANSVLARRFPDVPNIGDLRDCVLPDVDIITAGFPCQPVSIAGERRGSSDERWLINDILAAIGRMGTRPLVFLENVRGLLTANGGHAMADVICGLARLGYMGRYGPLSSAAVGAPHRRERVWIFASHRDGIRREPVLGPALSNEHYLPWGDGAGRCGSDPRFGKYTAAVRRWERTHGPAPDPLDANRRLNAAFTEWMMGFPPGWCTGILRRRQAIRCVGNAVQPQTARAAFAALACGQTLLPATNNEELLPTPTTGADDRERYAQGGRSVRCAVLECTDGAGADRSDIYQDAGVLMPQGGGR